MAAAYLEKCQSYALWIKYQGGSWMEYVRRFEEYEEAVKESIRLISETDSVLRMKVEPVHYLRLSRFTPLEPVIDHFEELKDFVETHPDVALPPEAMSALKDALSEGREMTDEQARAYQEIDDEIPF